MSYQEFLEAKAELFKPVGFEVERAALNANLFEWQKDVVAWCLQVGRPLGALAVGLGKTVMQVEWAKHVQQHTGGRVLFVCPLAVAHQTVKEAERLNGVTIKYVRSQAEAARADTPFVITNQELILRDYFDPNAYDGLVLDEASKMLKAFTGKTRQKLTYTYDVVPYRSAWSATPAPNRLVELLNYGEFLGVKSTGEALTRWFVRDSQQANNLRLKGHSEAEFWEWLASWCVMISKPGDIGHSNAGYELPPLHIERVKVAVDHSRAHDQMDEHGQRALMVNGASSATEMWAEKRETLEDRAAAVADLVQSYPDETWMIWCDTNYEEEALAAAVEGAVVVTGSQSPEEKERLLTDFVEGRIKRLISKPTIAGYGLNCQYVCNRMVFAGLTHKWELVHQALGRIYRFGQENDCFAYMVFAETEAGIVASLDEKQIHYERMQRKMSEAMQVNGLTAGKGGGSRMTAEAPERKWQGEGWQVMQGDAVNWLRRMESNSIHLGVSSWPFSDQYMYSASLADFGNCANDDHFFEQMDYLLPELFRVTIPGRLQMVHAKDRIVYGTKNNGYFEIEPFSDRCVAAMRKHGFLFVGRITIATDPVRENNQTNRLGYGRLLKDASTVHLGMPEYGLLFRKPHTQTAQGGMWSDERVVLDEAEYSLARHQLDSNSTWRTSGERLRYPYEVDGYDYDKHLAYLEQLDRQGKLGRANGQPLPTDAANVWWDINRADVLNAKLARHSNDERHICPLQLDFTERSIQRWSRPGERVLDYFGGIGSVAYKAVLARRVGIILELKPEYAVWAVKHCREAEASMGQLTLADLAAAA